ncbi:hypothetical protein J2W88_003966 [Acidovorax delafieldii]|uniref:Phosphoadenosine phosphosulfate reductase family protein n=1 Tax=Acidovorax delafieldii TaxID=47920 RepID=A0AAJ2F2R1_ACIDE|nr:hypothetical protein [Acidovorax delafieldii]MDR6768662.1 hypothetical protein [Acidovorax delafieldii]MDR6837378.1 hypothetical protein [Acidovorax delafieldii]MDR7366868.1 hypothetical protein [Acidovorax delafieldii]
MGERPRIRASFSGGRSSALMCEVLQDEYGDTHEIVYTFCNTSWERPETLDFAHAVDRHLGLNLVWLEAVVHPGRKSCTHRVVSYETAKRNGEVFDAVAAKYGLPNQVFKWCTRELKTNVMNSYARSIGWLPGTYDTAIGIRADEPRRVRRDVAERERIIYPLVDIRYVTKEDVLDHFEGQSWDLKIEEHQGNCIACYKKSDRKLYTLYREDPANFDFPVRLDQLYRNVGPNNVPGPRKMYRGYESAPDLVARFEAAGPSYRPPIYEGGCSESCEVYETEQIELFPA